MNVFPSRTATITTDLNNRAGVKVAARETTIVAALAFLIPFALGGPQLIVGSLVNAALVYAALNVSAGRALPVVFMPSIAALGRGVLFGALTPFLVIMIPFIWAGNALLVYSIKMMSSRNVPLWISLPCAAAIKAGWLFAFASLFVQLDLLPVAMLSGMGLIQLSTALIGAAIAAGATAAVNGLVKSRR